MDFIKIEKKWQAAWEKAKIFESSEKSKKKKFYCLEMFPYPSGSGLHMGHTKNYVIGDIFSRFKRMKGFNVLYPMGYDAFGLPAENAAIKAGVDPEKYTKEIIANFIKQQKAIGLSYDWPRTIATCEPEYYKWNQFFFLKFFERGLVYRKKAAVNWCPKCQTVLANEQVQGGVCWRHTDTQVEIKQLEQWFVKTTNYADELLEGIKELQWPERIKIMQENWIGKSFGTEIDFEIAHDREKKKILIGTMNKAKISMIKNAFASFPEIEFISLEDFPNLDDSALKEGNDFRENSHKKAEFYFKKTGIRTISTDQIQWVEKYPKENGFIVHVRKLANPNSPRASDEEVGKWIEEFVEKHGDSRANFHFAISYADENGIKDFVSIQKEYILQKEKSKKSNDGYAFDKYMKDSNTGEFRIEQPEHIAFSKFHDFVREEFVPSVFPNLKKWPIFTTRPDTIFGVTFMVVSAQHPRLMELVTQKQKIEVENFLKKIKSTSEKETEELNKEGAFTGSYAINPATGEKIPIYPVNFVIADYGSGMVMAVPAHDQRDFEFAKKYGLPIKRVISPSKQSCIIVHGSNSSEAAAKKGALENLRHWKPWLKKNLEKNGIKTYNELYPEDWLPDYDKWKSVFEKNTIDENTILVGHSAGTGFLLRWLSENKKKVNKLILVAPSVIKKNDKYLRLSKLKDFSYDSSLKNYFNKLVVFYSDSDAEHIIESAKQIHTRLGGDLVQIKGKGHFIYEDMGTEEFPELLEVILILNEAFTGDGVLVNSGNFSGMNNREAIEEITKYLESKNLGKKVVNYKLRDWLISRQRYWGTPIPIIYCGKCGIVPVPEKDLPILLPKDVKFGQGNPLLTSEKFVKTKCPKCKSPAKRETDTMDTFFDSSWYYLRYCDSKNSKVPFEKKKAEYWMPVDQYIGGAEHACMHLIYARFFTKVLRDMGMLKFGEPFPKLFNQGMLHKDGFVMSKSRGNVVSPDEVSKKYGIDAARFFLMFAAAPDRDTEWTEDGIESGSRVVSKLISIGKKKFGRDDLKLLNKLHRAIIFVEENLEKFQYNFALVKLSDLLGRFEKAEYSKKSFETLLLLFSPFMPHICEELWHSIGNKSFISEEIWPAAEKKFISEEIEQQEKSLEKTMEDVRHILKIVGKPAKKIYIYAIPKEVEVYKEMSGELKKEFSAEVNVFAVNNPKKYDPEGKAGKAKPGKPGILVE